MTMTHDEMIAVIAAHRDGKTIQFQYLTNQYPDEWSVPLEGRSPSWSFGTHRYRVKPEPLTIWATVYKDKKGEEYVGGYYANEESAKNGASESVIRIAKLTEGDK